MDSRTAVPPLRTLLCLAALTVPVALPATPSSAQEAGEVQTVQGWNVRYPIPSGWALVRAEGRVRVFQDPTRSATLIAAPGVSATPAEIQNELVALAGALGLQGTPSTDLHATTVSGRPVIAGEYDLVSPSTGQRVAGRSLTLQGGDGTSFGMVVLTSPERFAAIRDEVDRLVGAVEIGAPTLDAAAVAALAGRWTFYSGNSSPSIAGSGSWAHSYEETVAFDGVGSFEFTSSSSVGASSARTNEGSWSDVSSIGGGNAQGTYTVIGNTIVITTPQGRAAYEYALRGGALVAGGKTYIRGS
ncbi:MAG: hypothetical protein R3E98_15340 [Gemmatimonadota bacterium]|nr:hypothetical protein [Gemmatimonadota bacterium]